MRAQSAILTKRVLASAVPALALLCFVGRVQAGDPIQVSGGKSGPAPTDSRQVDSDLFKQKPRTKLPSSPLNSITPFIGLGNSIDPKEDRRLKNIQDEKKNWMLLEPGELQKRDEEDDGKFGGKSIGIDKDDDQSRNYLFYTSTQDRGDKAKAVPRNAPADIDDEPKKDTRPTLSVLPREADKPGAHTVSELNLKGLVNPSQVNAAKFNQNEASVFQFLKDNSAPGVDRDQQARRESFRDFINGPSATPASPGGISDPINFRADFSQERMNPMTPTRPTFDLPSSKPADSSFLPKASLGAFTPGRPQALPEMIGAAPRQATPGSYLPSPYLMQNNDPLKAPKASVMGNNGLFNHDTPAFRR